jgi:hypothetical protein
MSSETIPVAYWFFRLNGCLTITNFIVHPEKRGSQRTEADILGVRFPYRCELKVSSHPMEDYKEFLKFPNKIQIIFAELTKGKCKLNKPYLQPKKKNIESILYALGVFPENCVDKVAKEIYNNQFYEDENIVFRFFAIGKEKRDTLKSKVVQLTWNEILVFIYNRMKEYYRQKVNHQQWDEYGHQLYDDSIKSSQDDFIKTWLNKLL